MGSQWATQWSPQDASVNTQLGPPPVFRNEKDALLSMWNRTPEATYPDGYLGTAAATTRRADRLLQAGGRTNQRQYQRGVHKGERVDPSDYLWPAEFNNMTGIMLEAQGRKFAPSGAVPTTLTNDGKPIAKTPVVMDPNRAAQMRRFLPAWR